MRSTLARSPSKSSSTTLTDLPESIDCHVASVTANLEEDSQFAEIRQLTGTDPLMIKLKSLIQEGWTSSPSSLPRELQPYYSARNSLSVANRVVLHGSRICIPPSLRGKTLANLHDGHQGIGKCRALACNSVWWPGLSSCIKQYVSNCTTCAKFRAEISEPLEPSTFPARPWQKIACDLAESQHKTYLIVVDYFSRYIEIAHLTSTTSAAVIKVLDSLFAMHGIPETLVSDNAPQFSCSAFASFAADAGFTHRTSSPKFAQSNGAAERAVQTAKRLLKSTSSINEALLAYRSTPLSNGFSPAELLFGRKIRTRVPKHTASSILAGLSQASST